MVILFFGGCALGKVLLRDCCAGITAWTGGVCAGLEFAAFLKGGAENVDQRRSERESLRVKSFNFSNAVVNAASGGEKLE